MSHNSQELSQKKTLTNVSNVKTFKESKWINTIPKWYLQQKTALSVLFQTHFYIHIMNARFSSLKEFFANDGFIESHKKEKRKIAS